MPLHRFRLLLAILPLAGCASSVPLRVERTGTLPDGRYTQFDQAAATLPNVSTHVGNGSFPEPKWVFAFDAPFDPRAAPLQVGAFVGHGELAGRVASNLPGQLVRVIGETRLFPGVTLQPTPHAYLLAGTVTRAEDQSDMTGGPATQVEATVSRDGVVLGAIQVNSVQIGMVPLSPFMLLASAAMNAGQGTRASFVSERFADIFQAASKGTLSQAWSGGISRRFLYSPATTD